MHAALQGALIGGGIGLLLLFFDYTMIQKEVKDRAKRLHRAPEMDVTERGRLLTMLRFALFLPVGFAIAWWLIWG